jgi:hypothetical protein
MMATKARATTRVGVESKHDSVIAPKDVEAER